MSTAPTTPEFSTPLATETSVGVVPTSSTPGDGQRIVLDGITWDAYLAIDNALGEHSSARVAYLDGRLSIVTKSLEHDAGSEYLGYLIGVIASVLGIPCVPAGSTTYRREDQGAGVEGDKAFYFGINAERMRGQKRVDLANQPPPDLVVEVEVTHPADISIPAYAAMGVSEVWRLDARQNSLLFLKLQPEGRYQPVDQSSCLPALTPRDVLEQLAAAERLDLSGWLPELMNWARTELLARPGRV